MPEETKMAVEKENTSPAKSKTSTMNRSGNTLAQVTMLDGSILEVNIEVRTDKMLVIFFNLNWMKQNCKVYIWNILTFVFVTKFFG